MTTTFIFVITGVFSAVGILVLFAYRLQWIKKIRISFPETDESSLDKFIKKSFGNGKVEKYISKLWGITQKIVREFVKYLEGHSITQKIKDRADRILGKRKTIPKRETSSLFLKSIAEHKKKMHEEESDKENNVPG